MSAYLEEYIRDLIQKAIKRGDLFHQKGEIVEAANAFERVVRLYKQYAESAPKTHAGQQQRAQRLKKADEYEKLAARLRSGEDHPRTESTKGDSSDELQSEIMKLITKVKVAWDDIGGLDKTKRDIKYAYGLTMASMPAGVFLEPWKNILFYGPPGTGKTLLAAATSNGLDATFFNVKVSNLLSKYFGESSKLVTKLYDMARATAPAVVFLDEFDALASSRDSGDSGAERRLLSTILAELDGLAEKGGTRYVMTIAATNTPWVIDSAVLSRFQKRVFIPLPDQKAREQIFEIHIGKKGIPSKANYSELARMTRGYSGREIGKIANAAISTMIEEENHKIPEVVDSGRDAISKYELKLREITDDDFSKAMKEFRPDTQDRPSKAFELWTSNTPES